jgi:hypothetical protein
MKTFYEIYRIEKSVEKENRTFFHHLPRVGASDGL